MSQRYLNMLDELLSDGESRDSTPSPSQSPSPSVDNMPVSTRFDFIGHYHVNHPITNAYQSGTMIQSLSPSSKNRVNLHGCELGDVKYTTKELRSLLEKAADRYVNDVTADVTIVRTGRMLNLKHDQSIIHVLTVSDLITKITNQD